MSHDATQGWTRKALDPEALKSLEQQRGAEVGRGRVHARVEAALTVRVRPDDAAERSGVELEGVSADVSRGGCRLILPLPTLVGDEFRIEFASGSPRIPTVLARCLRCRLVREGVFESAFSFRAPVDLPE